MLTNARLLLQTDSEQRSAHFEQTLGLTRRLHEDLPDLRLKRGQQVKVVEEKFPKAPVEQERLATEVESVRATGGKNLEHVAVLRRSDQTSEVGNSQPTLPICFAVDAQELIDCALVGLIGHSEDAHLFQALHQVQRSDEALLVPVEGLPSVHQIELHALFHELALDALYLAL